MVDVCSPAPAYVIGIDGGGSGTRARLQSPDGRTLGYGRAGPSGLSQGVEQAWRHVEQAVDAAFAAAGLLRATHARCAIGLGLAGASRPEQRAAFTAMNPGYAPLVLDTDAATMLLGAHGERRGIVVAAGTGSVGAVREPDGTVRIAGGWGFPVGDEGSGAWLGLRAVHHVQAALDRRAPLGPLARAVLGVTGATPAHVLAWCAAAGQRTYATLAPHVFDAAKAGDRAADALLQDAADELALLETALQPDGPLLPIVVTGSIGERLIDRWPADLRSRCVRPRGDSADGALHLVRAALAAAPATPASTR